MKTASQNGDKFMIPPLNQTLNQLNSAMSVQDKTGSYPALAVDAMDKESEAPHPLHICRILARPDTHSNLSISVAISIK